MSDIGSTSEDPASVSGALGGADTPLASARVGLGADTRAISKLKSEFTSLRQELEKVRKEMERIEKASRGISGPGGANANIGNTPMAGGTFTPATPGTQTGKPAPSGGGGGGGGGGGAPVTGAGTRMGGAMGAISIASTITNAAFQMLDNRIDRARPYALSADRMSVVYQQMYGLSQGQVVSQYRTPMAQFRLGEGGINALMSLQTTTGLSALQQASSVEALRTISGYSMSAGQATSMMAQMASPEVVNRMFMLGGTGLIGPGGQQRTTMQVIQDLTRRSGLTNEAIARSALTPGSITRANLTQMGVTGDLQDMVIQYAMENIQYRNRGGTGMYDPNNRAQRRLMGIEENFATQAEETDRLRAVREEDFYRNQADNFADLERQTQSLTKAMTGLENSLQGIIGMGISGTGTRKILGAAGTLIGGTVGFALGGPGGALAGAMLLNTAGNLIGTALGDGGASSGGGSSGGGSSVSIPHGYQGGSTTIADLKNNSSFSNLHPTLQDRLTQMFMDNPNVGFGGGYRSEAAQEALFLSRYTESEQKTDIYWNGKYWKKVSGHDVAPPGKSMHEIGLAADLVGDLDWVVQNAHKYGLKHFADVNNEPHHVQLAELPNARSEYEKQGSVLGTGSQPSGVGSQPSGVGGSTTSPVSEDGGSYAGSGASPGSSPGTSPLGTSVSGVLGQKTIAEKIALVKATAMSNRTQGGFSQRGSAGGNSGSPDSATTSSSSTPVNATSGGQMTGEQVAQILYNAGFRGEDLVAALAISWRESRWDAGAFVSDEDDLSYGLMQINMIPGATNPEGNRRDWGISSNEALFDPATNARIAYEKYKWNRSNNRDAFQDWEIGGNHLSGTSSIYPEATRIVNDMGLRGGDGAFSAPGPSSRSSMTSVSGNHTFNISPNITLNGSATGDDLRRIATEVARLIEQEVKRTTLRSI
jgi:hypothetical protein